MLHEVRHACNFNCLLIPAGYRLCELVSEACDLGLIDGIARLSRSDCAAKAQHLTWIDDNSNRGNLLDVGVVLQTYFNLHAVLTLIHVARRLNSQCLSVLVQGQEVLYGSFIDYSVEPFTTVCQTVLVAIDQAYCVLDGPNSISDNLTLNCALVKLSI